MSVIIRSFVTAVLVGAAVLNAAQGDTINREFPIAPGGSLVLVSDLGSIQVTGGPSSGVQVEVTRQGDAAEVEAFQVEFASEAQTLRVTGRWRDQDRKKRKLKVAYVIRVPERFNIDLRTSAGGIQVSDLEGSVKTVSSGGSLRFGNIAGPVWGRTSGGGIDLASSKGPADLATSGGSVHIGHVDGNVVAASSGGSIHIDSARGSVEAATSGGSIHVNEVLGAIQARTSGGSVRASITRQPAADCVLTTSGGSITVELFADASLSLDAKTSGGKVVSDFPIQVQGARRSQHLVGDIGQGGPHLRLRTSGGNIEIRRGGPATRVEAEVRYEGPAQ